MRGSPVAWISGSPSMARPFTSNTPSGIKLESNRAVSFVSKAITHRYSASTTASRLVMGGLRTAGRENGDVMVQAWRLFKESRMSLCVVLGRFGARDVRQLDYGLILVWRRGL